eukprot:TRINITY_DN480_c0_g1_i1.p1 TRINITY_DN480_c0_g1~~TRINITY_DN480_c0_g1_i1.p1  ORF type:complete len:219 (-),score=19.20 TRINITY_DN480_c0_g1_i1:58-714(-)
MMKAIVAITFLITVTSAQFCVDLIQDDTTCAAGTKANWPTKVCNQEQVNMTTSTYCDSETGLNFWRTICPVQNNDDAAFCEGTGYYSYGFKFASLCGSGLQTCTEDADCVAPPVYIDNTPLTDIVPCFECCTFCNDNESCMMRLEAGLFSNDTATCSPCTTAAPQSDSPVDSNVPLANQPSGSAPTTTLSPVSKTPNSSTSVAASVFATLIVAAVLMA